MLLRLFQMLDTGGTNLALTFSKSPFDVSCTRRQLLGALMQHETLPRVTLSSAEVMAASHHRLLFCRAGPSALQPGQNYLPALFLCGVFRTTLFWTNFVFRISKSFSDQNRCQIFVTFFRHRSERLSLAARFKIFRSVRLTSLFNSFKMTGHLSIMFH